MKRTHDTTLLIRWRIQSDNSALLRIDSRCYLEPLTHTDLNNMLRDRSVIAVVAEDRGNVLGYCIYQLRPSAIKILRMGVDTIERRNGIATAFLDRLKSKLRVDRDTIVMDTPGVSLAAQLCLAKAGFVAEPRPNDMIRFTFDLETNDD